MKAWKKEKMYVELILMAYEYNLDVSNKNISFEICVMKYNER